MRYHFQIVDYSASLDADVVDLDSYEQALDHATALAAELLNQEPYSENPDAWEIRVTDDNGREVLSVPISASQDLI